LIRELFNGEQRGECRGDWEHFKFNSKKSAVTMAMCDRCVVREACLEYALEHESYGIWGGANEKDRKKIRKERGIPQPPLLGYYNPLFPVNVKITNARSAQRMREMRYRRQEESV
jgi:hypothetical protein